MSKNEKSNIKKSRYAFGIASRTFDDNHIFMSDIDENLPLSEVVEVAQEIQREFLLFQIHIIKSSKGWNLVSLDKLPLKLVYMINNEIPKACRKYNRMSFYNRRFYVLRMGSDKVVEADVRVEGGNPLFVQSFAHRVFFRKYLKSFDDVCPPCFYDNQNRFVITKFESDKHGVEFQ